MLFIWIILFLPITNLSYGSPTVSCIDSERQALLNFKKSINDSTNTLSSWTATGEEDCCRWDRVSCDIHSGHVLELYLNELEMSGELSSSLLDLPYLTFLDLSFNYFTKIPDFIGSFSKLTYLDLSFNQLEGGLPSSFGNFCHLKRLDMYENNLNGSLSSILDNLSCAKNSLEILNLSYNQLRGSISDFTEFSSLTELYLDHNNLDGTFPKGFKYFSRLNILYLEGNQLVGPLPSFSKLSFLNELHLANNSINGSISESIYELSGLQFLDLSSNKLTGSISENIRELSNLQSLNLSSNKLIGNISESIGELTNLYSLDFSSNTLNGVLSEAHLSNWPELEQMDLSYNLVSLNVSSDWIPPFQLYTIKLRSCKLGPQFPAWLQNQRNFSYLDISNSEISDSVPDWFWNLPLNLEYLNLSSNHIYGKVSDVSSKFYTFPVIDLSSNSFYGRIPQFLFHTSAIILCKNKFSGPLSSLCTIKHIALKYIDLSNNLLSGFLPDCWAQLKQVVILNLENNNFSGKIPDSIGSLAQISTLSLRNNSFTGELPSSLKRCSSLVLLDLGENKLTGKLPKWIGESLTSLIVLRLRSNEFHGEIPSTICHLILIQIIDLSFNNLSGIIHPCLDNLTVMTDNQTSQINLSHMFYHLDKVFESDRFPTKLAIFVDHALVMWRGIEREYHKTLGLLKIIDFSNNNLSGEIPKQVTSLLGMISLNLSKNSLTGSIPEEIGQLKLLEVLDLSHNQLSGEIPGSIIDLSFLGMLDLSNNQLTSRIPTSTQLQSFDVSTYSNNSGLCGPPLPKCPGEGTLQDPSRVGDTRNNNTEEGEEWFERSWLYASAGVGFFVGFWGLYGSLMINTSWRYNYFQFLNKVVEWFYFR